MITNHTPTTLRFFEQRVADEFHAGKLPYAIHFSGGNEETLIDIFQDIKECDWVFSTWRSHYHALLKGIPADRLMEMIREGRSMHIMSKEHRFFAAAIVGGCIPIATGVAQAIAKRRGSEKVFVFIGDGAEDQGVFYESVRYAQAFELPIKFVIEDNSLAVDTPKSERIGCFCMPWPLEYVHRYYYSRQWPHVGTGRIVQGYM